jgi:protein TonB
MKKNSSLHETSSMKVFISLPILAVVLILSSSALFAQNTSKDATDSTKILQEVDIFTPVEVEPGFDEEELRSHLIYPEEARKNNIQGKVIVMVYISKEGKPVKTRITQSDNPLLEEAAVNAVMQIAYTPAIQLGKPVGVWIAIPITFSFR